MASTGIEIRTIATEIELAASVLVIRKAFRTVAEEFRLTKDNCPTHPSFLTLAALKNRAEKGLICFGLFEPSGQIGFVAASQEADGLFYLEKLAVLPDFRHRGYGRMLVDHVFSFARRNNGNRISIALIDESEILKRWYRDYGFREAETKTFPQLPFAVCFMEKEIE